MNVYPMTTSEEIVKVAGCAFDCIKEMYSVYEREKTVRYEIGKKFELCAKAIEAHTREVQMAIEANAELRSKYIDTICMIAARERIDENELAMVDKLMSQLDATNPIKALGTGTPIMLK